MKQFQGRTLSELVVWSAVCGGMVRVRSRDALPVRMATVRIVDRHDGTTIKTLYGLNAQTEQVSDVELAIRLMLQAEHKTSYRLAASVWKNLDHSDAGGPALTHAMTSMQMGLAAWHLGQAQTSEPARRLVPALTGARKLGALSHATSLMKLFALKEMMR